MNTLLVRSLTGIFLPLLVAGCNLTPIRILNPGTPVSGTVAIWVSAGQDTYISCGQTSACEEGGRNFGRDRTLAVAGTGIARKVAFVHFELPPLPAGTQILETYLELNHNAQQEDGQTDDVKITVSVPRAPWNAMTLTWNNNQNNPAYSAGYPVCLRSSAWSGSPDITADIRERQSYDVFLSWPHPPAAPPIDKKFASVNDSSRNEDHPGLAPRLLIRAELPPGASINSRTFDSFQPSEDLGSLPQPVLTSLAVASASWPPSWQVAAASGACQ